MNYIGLVGLVFFLTEHSVCSASIVDVVKKIHEGVDDVVEGKIKGATEVVGKPADIEDVNFYLVTSEDEADVNNTVDPYSPKSVAQTDGNIFFLIHGWSQSRSSCPWYKPLTGVLLKKYPDAHIVQVDWGKSAMDVYAFSAFSTESVGQIVTIVIQKLVKENNVSLQKIVMIGHSLGGQISGWAGKDYLKRNNESLPRIIALDPAGPIFDIRPDSRRLNKHDADVVMVIHTDRRKLGFPTNCGSIDFFPNDGVNQPDCLKLNLTDLSLSSLSDAVSCSHGRSHQLFIEAVKQPDGFIATECNNYEEYKEHKCDDNQKVSMGDWQTTETGSYYLETTGEPPFIKNQNITDISEIPKTD